MCYRSWYVQEHPLFDAVQCATPVGKAFAIVIPSRKYIEKIVAFFNKCTLKTFVDAVDVEPGDNSKAAVKLGDKVHLRSYADITDALLRKRKCRLIIRNLSFQATNQNVIDKLQKFGPIVEVSIPVVEVAKPTPEDASARDGKRSAHPAKRRRGRDAGGDAGGAANEDDEDDDDNNGDEDDGARKSRLSTSSKTKVHPRGFSFVTFLCEKDAMAAVTGSAGLKICNREVAFDHCSSKDIYRRLSEQQQQTPATGEEKETDGLGLEGDKEKDAEEEIDASEDEDKDGNSEDEDDEDDDDEEDDDEDDGSPKDEKLGTSPAAPKVSDAGEGKTVFLRYVVSIANESRHVSLLCYLAAVNRMIY